MTVVVDLVAGVMLLVGSALSLVAAIGLLRLPDVFTRMHAATKPAVLGLMLICSGTALRLLPDVGDASKLVLVMALQLLTTPVGAHMIGRAAHRAGELGELTAVDELAEAERRERA